MSTIPLIHVFFTNFRSLRLSFRVAVRIFQKYSEHVQFTRRNGGRNTRWESGETAEKAHAQINFRAAEGSLGNAVFPSTVDAGMHQIQTAPGP